MTVSIDGTSGEHFFVNSYVKLQKLERELERAKSWFDELYDAQNNFTVEQSVFFLFIGCFRSSMNF